MKKFTAPYRYAPAIVSVDKIDTELARGSVAIHIGSGRVVFILDDEVQNKFRGNTGSSVKFVNSYNQALRKLHPDVTVPDVQTYQKSGWFVAVW